MRTKLTFRHRTTTPTADRETELRALMTMASHDMKNPLATATAHLAMLREDHPDLGDDFHRDLDTIERALHRITRLTGELLDYARTDRDLDPKPTPLDHLITDIITDHTPTTDTAHITVTSPLPTVTADPTLLHHVLDNLIGNAIKYTPTGTTPDIEIHAHTHTDGTTRIEIADHGIGIPTTEQPRIFDAFHRATNSTGYTGTGLGLNICRRIIERHGGQIGVQDNPGGGSRFWFTLPGTRPVPGTAVRTGTPVAQMS
jgi:signal transduction histidine kinase